MEEVEEDILQEEVVAFLELGEKYQVERLKELAEQKMLQLQQRPNKDVKPTKEYLWRGCNTCIMQV